MEELICNPHKGKLETINIQYDETNTTGFNDCSTSEDIYSLTDIRRVLKRLVFKLIKTVG